MKIKTKLLNLSITCELSFDDVEMAYSNFKSKTPRGTFRKFIDEYILSPFDIDDTGEVA